MNMTEFTICIGECEDPRLKQPIVLPFDQENDLHFLVPKGQKEMYLKFLENLDLEKLEPILNNK